MCQSFAKRLFAMSLLAAFCLVGSNLNALAVEQEGTSVSITGELQVFYQDDFENQRSDMAYELEEKGSKKRFKLHFKGKKAPKHLRPGQTITVRGKARGRDLFLAADDSGTQNVQVLEPATLAAAAVAGEQRTIVLVADFTDFSVTCPVSDVEDLMFTDPAGQSVDDLYQRTSLNQLSFTGTVAGPFTIGFSGYDPCDVSAYGQAIDSAAQDSGVDLTQYDRIVYVLPQDNSCGYAGIGQVGATPSRSWVLTCSLEDVYAHELGHNLGMGHAATPTSDYGDKSDIMGYSGIGLRQLNAPHVEQMGWYDPQKLVSASNSGYYDIAPLVTDGVPVAPQILKISKPDSGDFYYISYRQPAGFDGNLRDIYLNRLSIHTYMADGSSRKSYLIQTLGDNESFVDAVNGITITQVSHFPEYATALVEVDNSGVCVPSAPNLTVTTGTQTGQPSDSLDYSVTVSNIDGVNCAASTFVLDQTLPTGWSGSVAPVALTLQPGDTASAIFTVTSSAMAADGSYSLSYQVSDAIEPIHTTAKSGNYMVVSNTEDTIAPTAPNDFSASLKRKQANLAWNPATDNVGVSGYQVWRDGALLAETVDTSFIDRSVPSGVVCSYFVVATDAAGNESAASNSATVGDSSGGGGKGGGKGNNR